MAVLNRPKFINQTKWDQHFADLHDNPVFMTGCQIITDNYANFNLLLMKLRNFVPFGSLQAGKEFHLAIASVVGDEVRILVYENIYFNLAELVATPGAPFGNTHETNARSHALYYTSWAMPQLTRNTWAKDMLDELKSHPLKWRNGNDFSRGIKAIGKTTGMTLGKYLKNYTNFEAACGTAASTLRDYVTTISDSILPLKVKITKDLKTIREVYTNGPTSCMKPQPGRKWEGSGVEPVDWYSYCPETQVAYVESKGAVAARAVIFDNEMYGRIFSSGDAVTLKFREALEGMGYKPIVTSKAFYTMKHAFEVNGIQGGKHGVICPFPYLDYVNPIRWKYDEVENKFMFDPNNKDYQEQAALAEGLLYAKRSGVNLRCEYCEERLPPGHPTITTLDGHVFCSPTHARELSYIRMYQGEGARVYAHSTTPGIIIDELDHTCIYFNMRTVEQMGCCPYLRLDEDGNLLLPETLDGHKEWTRAGSSISLPGWANIRFMVNAGDRERLHYANKISDSGLYKIQESYHVSKVTTRVTTDDIVVER